ncbi:MAG: metal-dependent hydrolase [Candidatus Helarchaeota archaeon]|nr:metal-dependent hydrolase [Candidatus Helarchaeota archaeon]
MVSFISHMAIGILFAEIILRLRTKDLNERSEKRVKYWTIGLIAGLIPDLDIIPGYILGVHPYTFHHIYTHTFLALGIVAIACLVIFRKNELAFPFFTGYGMHLVFDYFDNSISPLGPFVPEIELGLLCGWGTIPGGSWASEYWLLPGYESHTLWAIFMNNGWGIPIGFEFLSIYDLVFIVIFFILFIILIRLVFKRRSLKKGEVKMALTWSILTISNRPKFFPFSFYSKNSDNIIQEIQFNSRNFLYL